MRGARLSTPHGTLGTDYEDSALLAWRPPYWDAGNVEECAVPGSRVEFKDE